MCRQTGLASRPGPPLFCAQADGSALGGAGSMSMLSILRRKQPNRREDRRFYLLPGMGGRAYHRKQRRIRIAAVIVGFLVSVLLGVILFMVNSRPGK